MAKKKKKKETTEKGHPSSKETDRSQSINGQAQDTHNLWSPSGFRGHDLRKTSAHFFMESRETSLN